jgi:uncharacterized membrane protein (DUF485 family)
MTDTRRVVSDSADRAPIDWERAARTPELEELVARRRRFVLTATVVALVWTFGFVLLTSYAQGFMSTFIVDGLTVGYVLALSVFLMTWTLIWRYLRKSREELEPMERRAAEAARRTAETSSRPPAEGTQPAGPSGEGSGR